MEKQKWSVDPTHSEVQFKVRHMMITNVTGNFNAFDITAETEGDDFSTAKLVFKAPIDSISTNNEQRDAHLKGADFFDAQNYPELIFESDRIEKSGSDEFDVYGKFKIRGVSKDAKLKMELGGISNDPFGNRKAGLTLSGKINRNDYGLTWNTPLESGGVLVSEDVKLHSEIQLVKQ